MTKRNYKICTLDKNHDCKKCSIKDQVKCNKASNKDTLFFYGILIPLFIASFAILITAGVYTGTWWPVPLNILFWLVYQLYNEVVVHCTHCPFWDEDSDTIHCMVNCGIAKPRWKWFKKYLKYNPAPYSLKEKIILNFFNYFSVFFPVSIMIYTLINIQNTIIYTISAVYLIILANFNFLLKKHHCSYCLNFDCPLNKVPKKVVDEYLRKNPYIKDAWEKNGYKLSE